MNIKLTEVQKAYLLGRSETFRGRTGTHIYIELEFRGDILKLNEAFNELIRKQPMLRASVLDLEYFQINEPFEYKIAVERAADQESEVRDRFIAAKRCELSHKLYSSNSFPFFTIEAMETALDTYYLFFSLDLLIADGMSVFQLFDQWRSLYEDVAYKLDDMTDNLFMINQNYHEEKQSVRYKKGREYWLNKMEEMPEAPEMHLNIDQLLESDFQRLEYSFSEDDYLKMTAIANELGVSINTIFLTLYAAVLQRWSMSNALTINMTTFKRPRQEEYLSVIGDFTSTSLIQTNIDCAQSLRANVHKLQRTINESFRYSAFEGVEVLRELSKKSNRSNQMPFVFTSMLFDFRSFDPFFKLHYWISETPQVFLDCQLKLINKELNVSWDYLSRIFQPTQITDMFTSFIEMITAFLIDGDEVLERMEKQRLEKLHSRFEEYNMPALRARKCIPIIEAYQDLLQRYSGSIAFEDLDHTITFAELDQHSDIISQKIRELKATHQLSKVRVAILTSKSVACIAEMLAVIKTGDSFCFVNPDLPEERISYITSAIHNELCIQAGEVTYIPCGLGASSIPKDELYVIFTSGTTGRPKGISINEMAALNTIYDLHDRLSADSSDVIFNISELSFDLSVFDILSPLLIGCKTILCRGINEFVKYKYSLPEVTIWNSTPGLVQMLIKALGKENKLMAMRSILMSGDFIPAQIVDAIRSTFSRSDLLIISLGGATEASIWSIYYPLSQGIDKPKIPYGYPLTNQSMYVLDERNQLTEDFAYGEICIGGEGLANGYLDEERTEAAFFDHEALGRLYRTGDKGFMSREGYLEIVGRMQFELKINGYRIDLIEIANAVQQLKEVQQAKVFVKSNKNKGTLVAVYTTSGGEQLTASYMRSSLHKSLPDYMIPTTFIKVDEIPLNMNGKVDTKQLENWLGDMEATPLQPDEQQLLELWRQIIGPDAEELNHVYENFFDAGGDSIKLPELLHEIQALHHIPLSIEDLLNHFSLKEQAKLITERRQMNTEPKQALHKQLVQLAKGRTDKKIVLIHAGSGEIAIYNALSRELDSDYSVYAMKFAKDYNEVAPRTFSLARLAEQYDEALKSLGQVEYLGGWCIGGAIGFELAKRNANIKHLLLINSMPPVNTVKDTFDFSLEAEQLFIKKSLGMKITTGISNSTDLWNEVIAYLEAHPEFMPRLVSIVPHELARLIPFFGSNKPRELIYYINLFRSFENARFRYSNEQSIRIPMLYIGAQDEAVENYIDWSKHSTGNWYEDHVPGDHTTIFDAEHVEELAKAINRMLITVPMNVLN